MTQERLHRETVTVERSGSVFGSSHDHAACTERALALAELVCARRGTRLTAIRRRVLELVWDSHAPVLAYDLLEQLRAEGRRAAPPTVYRALQFLSGNGLIHRIESLNAFVGCGDPREVHHGQFLICRRCRQVTELADDEVENVLRRKARTVGFRIDHPTVEALGECPHCAATAVAGR